MNLKGRLRTVPLTLLLGQVLIREAEEEHGHPIEGGVRDLRQHALQGQRVLLVQRGASQKHVGAR